MSFFNLIFSSSKLKFWIIFSVCCRLILAITSQSYLHPDEWYQTVEFSNIIGHKAMTYSPEVYFHLRNLSWPAFLSIFPKFLNSPWLIIFFVQLTTVLLDCLILNTVYYLLDFYEVQQKHLWFIFFCVLHFFIKDSPRPSQEHLSTIAFFVTLLFLYKEVYLYAGILAVSITAFKYSGGMLSAGLSIALLINTILRQVSWKEFCLYLIGVFIGLGFFGLADLIYYGRAWESLYTYALYNIFSGLSFIKFGEQNATVYLQYLFSQYKVTHFVVFTLSFPFIIKFLFKDLKQKRYLALSIIFFLVGHLLTRHKEGRFIAPLEILFWVLIALSLSEFLKKEIFRKVLLGLTLLSLIFTLIELKCDFFKPNFSYLKLKNLTEENSVCAAIVLRRPFGFFFDKGLPAQGFISMSKKDNWSQAMKEKALIWMEKMPDCSYAPQVLIQAFQKDPFFDDNQCAIKNEFGAPWYMCPSKILSKFEKQEMRKILVNKFIYHHKLWDLDTKPDELLLDQQDFEQKMAISIGSFPDW